MDYTLSKHAEDAIREREIRPEWIARTVATPQLLNQIRTIPI